MASPQLEKIVAQSNEMCKVGAKEASKLEK
jgi:hypothetical protein